MGSITGIDWGIDGVNSSQRKQLEAVKRDLFQAVAFSVLTNGDRDMIDVDCFIQHVRELSEAIWAGAVDFSKGEAK